MEYCDAKGTYSRIGLYQELAVLEPRSPEDIYKTHLEEKRSGVTMPPQVIDSAKQNLAASFVNALVNVGE